ncbi:hypothetical protein D9M72_487680 [compost metagenome]
MAHGRQHAGERSEKTRNRIGNDGRISVDGVCRFGVEVDGYAGDLGTKPLDDVRKHRAATQVKVGLGASHAARQSACEDDGG